MLVRIAGKQSHIILNTMFSPIQLANIDMNISAIQSNIHNMKFCFSLLELARPIKMTS